MRFQTLTEQMFYILLCLHEERRGMDILAMIRTLTDGRVNIGSGTLYDLLDQFVKEGMIQETKAKSRRRSYIITEKGQQMLDREYNRLLKQVADYERIFRLFRKGGSSGGSSSTTYPLKGVSFPHGHTMGVVLLRPAVSEDVHHYVGKDSKAP